MTTLPPAKPSSSTSPLHPVHALLVDSDPRDADRMKAALSERSQGRFEVEQVSGIEEAIDRLGENSLDVVLLDLSLPGVNGMESLRRTRATAPNLPVIVLMPLEDAEMIRTALHDGAQDYLVKGQWNGELLARSIRYAIERKQSEDDLHRRTSYLQLQQVIAVAANEAVSTEEAFRAGLDLVCGYTGCVLAHVYEMTTGSSPELVSTEIWHPHQPERYRTFREATRELRCPPGISLPGRVVDCGAPVWISDLQQDPGFRRRAAAVTDGLRSGFATPVWVGKEIVAVFEFFFENPTEPDPRLLEVMTDLGTQLGRVVERTRAASELRQQKEVLQKIFDHLPVMIVFMDRTGQVQMVNRCWESTLGWTLEEARQRDILAEFYPDPEYRRWVLDYILHPPSGWADFRTRARDGRTLDTRWANVLLSDGTSIGIGQDVTERKGAELALRESEAQYRTLVEQLPVVAYKAEFGACGRWLYASPQIESLLGFSPEEWTADPERWFRQLHPDDRERVLAEEERCHTTGTLFRCEYRLFTRDGRVLWFRDAADVVRNDQGSPEHLQGVLLDITERKQLEEQFLQAQKMEAVGRLAGGVAHDFNNLLSAIIGFSELSLKKIDPKDSLYRYVDEVKKAGERASSLTKQLLAFSRKQVLEPKIVDMNSIVTEMEKMLARLIGEDIELRTIPHTQRALVKADPGQLEQVVMNLAVNARDAMTRGGKLIIQISKATLDAIYAKQHPNVVPGEYVVLTVTDTGCGMTSEVQARLFEPFFTTKAQGKGTGLGLATCYGIVTQSGGHITVISQPGHGATFKVYFPCVSPAPDIAMAGNDLPEMPPGNETILWVEDDPALRQLGCLVLRGLGYKVLEAANGPQALEIAAQNHPIHLLLADMIMPQMSGKELSEKLKAHHPHLPCLFASGFTHDADVLQPIIADGAAFLQKPFTPSSLARKVREMLDAQRTGSAPS